MLIVTVNLIFIGHLGDASKVASCGLGNMIIFIFGNAAFIGMNSGMETLVSQAYGAGNLALCGETYQRGRVVVMIYWFPLAVIFLLQGSFLTLLKQQQNVIDQTSHYLICMMPAAFLYGLNDLQNKFIIQMGKSSLILSTLSMALILHIFSNHYFVNVYNMDMSGCAFATCITYGFIFTVNRWKLL